jgi:D-glycero-alpha-D-manno-heptose 1-phosphate guanylyltransferase
MSRERSLDALVLAGGLGTRLRPALSDRPKAMADIGGRPFISLLFDQLIRFGFNRVIVATGYRAESISGYFGSRYQDLELVYSKENEPLGTGGALKLAHRHIHKQHVLVMNGDTFVDFALRGFFLKHLKTKSLVSLLLCKADDARAYGSVKMDNQGRITAFVEKKRELGSGCVSAGNYLISRDALKMLPGSKKFSLESKFFPTLVEGRGLMGHCSNNPLHDIGTPDTYRYFLSKMAEEESSRT